MGRCVFCGKDAGLLRGKHAECERINATGIAELRELIEAAADGRVNLDGLEARIATHRGQHYISTDQMRKVVVHAWGEAVEKAFADGVLTEAEENGLDHVRQTFSLTQEELDKSGSYSKLVKGAVLRDLMNGVTPSRIKVLGALPFNLQKSETLIWLFQDVQYFEQKTRRHYVGGSHGLSVRVAKGVYLRTGAFKGRSVERTETVNGGKGILAITNKHLYFGGALTKGFRIRHDKIVTVEPFSDGVGIQRDGATAKPQSFVTGDGWFTYNLLMNAGAL